MPLAGAIPSGSGRFGFIARRVIFGPALRSAALAEERMRKLLALPVLSSDALSSVAYGPEAMLVVLALAGSAQLKVSLPIAGAIIVLMIAVGFGVPAGDPGVSTGWRLVPGGQRESRIARRPAGRCGPDPGLHSHRHGVDCCRGGGSDLGDALAGERYGPDWSRRDRDPGRGQPSRSPGRRLDIRGPDVSVCDCDRADRDRGSDQGSGPRLRGHAAAGCTRHRSARRTVGATRVLLRGDRDDRDRGDLQRSPGVQASGGRQRRAHAFGDDRAVDLDVRRNRDPGSP